MSRAMIALMLALVAGLFVLAGHCLVVQRRVGAPVPYLPVRGDSLAYMRMIEEGCGALGPPFRYRVLVPLVARMLPCSPVNALRAVSYAGLFAFFGVSLAIGMRLGLGWGATVAGLVLVSASPWCLYWFHNPFLVDACAAGLSAVMFWAVLAGRFVPFAMALLFAVLAKETAVFWAPLGFLLGWRQGIAGIILGAVMFWVPRLVLGAGAQSAALSGAWAEYGQRWLAQPGALAREVWQAWGFVWLYALAGLCCLARAERRMAWAALWAVGAGAAFSAMVASDTGRMFTPLAPVMALGCAATCWALLRRGQWPVVVLMLAVAVSLVPNGVLRVRVYGLGGEWLPWIVGAMALLALCQCPKERVC